MVLLGAALIGVGCLNWDRKRAAARLFGLGAVSLTLLAVGGVCWRPLGDLGSARLLTPALLFAVVPAVHGVRRTARGLCRLLRSPLCGRLATIVLLVAGSLVLESQVRTLAERAQGSEPLQIGLNEDRQELVRLLGTRTTPEARILWEDRIGTGQTQRWTALLPVLTGRAYLGGLDPEAGIEHAYPCFVDEALAGQPIGSYSDEELVSYCDQYNVGWVVCWSPGSMVLAFLERGKGNGPGPGRHGRLPV